MGDIEIRPGSDFATTLKRVKEFSPELATSLRKELRNAGGLLVQDVRAAVRGQARGERIAKQTRRGHHKAGAKVSFRDAIASATSLKIVAGTTRQGISVVTDASKMPENIRAMAKAWNKKSFRHPVFGNRDRWVNQDGRPYFGSVINEHVAEVQEAMNTALSEALEKIGGN